MTSSQIPIILPVETQVRELDAKLLLACVAAERGHETFIGFQNDIRARITALPAGVFIAKGFASRKAKFLRILKQLGFAVIAWDEEGLVHYPPQMYYQRRMSRESLALVQALLAWGPDYAALVRGAPFYDGTPVFETGNPRIDLLRAEVREFYRADVDLLHQRFGRYILLNSNFGHQNSAVRRKRDEAPATAATDQDLEWQEQLRFRTELYGHFRDMVAGVAREFPDRMVILRPHPSEKIESWRDIESNHANLKVLFEGNVVPWLLGADVLIHNGCTTAIESVLLDRPAIAYQPVTSAKYDRHLPNSLSYPVASLDGLMSLARQNLAVSAQQRRNLDPYVAFSEGRLASDIIIDTIEREGPGWMQAHAPTATGRALGVASAEIRALEKRLRSFLPGDIYARWHQDKQFPPLSLDDVRNLVARFQAATGRFAGIAVSMPAVNIFRLAPGR